jgi:hypothetical protein
VVERYELHGGLMWGCWGALSLVMISMNRYLKLWWKYHYCLHATLGTLIMAITMFAGMLMIN